MALPERKPMPDVYKRQAYNVWRCGAQYNESPIIFFKKCDMILVFEYIQRCDFIIFVIKERDLDGVSSVVGSFGSIIAVVTIPINLINIVPTAIMLDVYKRQLFYHLRSASCRTL